MSDELDMIIRRKALELSRRALAGKGSGCPQAPVHANLETLRSLLKDCRVVLADFYATWCPPCRMVEHVFARLAREFQGRVGFAKINVDENPDLASAYGVLSIPTLIVFRRGVEFKRFIGYTPTLEEELRGALREALAS